MKKVDVPPLRCPMCGDGQLIEKTNGKTGHTFMGCDGWRSSDPPQGCQYTQAIPAYVHQLRAGAQQLPGFGG